MAHVDEIRRHSTAAQGHNRDIQPKNLGSPCFRALTTTNQASLPSGISMRWNHQVPAVSRSS